MNKEKVKFLIQSISVLLEELAEEVEPTIKGKEKIDIDNYEPEYFEED